MKTEAPAISADFDPHHSLDRLLNEGSPTHGDALVEWLTLADHVDTDPILDKLARAAVDDHRALDALIGTVYRGRFARAAIRLVVFDDTDVDEALQNTVLIVSTKLEQWTGDGAVRSWIATIAKRQAVSVLRKRRPDVVQPSDDLEPVLAAERFSSRLADRRDIEGALAGLPESFARVVWLRDVEHRSYSEIAQDLDIPINTVRSRLARGRAVAQRSLRLDIAEDPEREL